jgi:N utilization substance protein B
VSERTPGLRRRAREAALQVLFAADPAGLDEATVSDTHAQVSLEFSLPRRADPRTRELVLGVAQNRKSIDERISAASRRWSIGRLARVDRNVLRIATYELLYEPDTPAEVVIDEAVEIVRRFAGGDSPAFVNGVLDAIARERGPASQ